MATGVAIVGVSAAILRTDLQIIPLHLLQILIGSVLVWFGWGWYKKSDFATGKTSTHGWITAPLEAEDIQLKTQHQHFSRLNFIVMFKSAALETLEVALGVARQRDAC